MAAESTPKLLRKTAAMAIHTNLTIDNPSALNKYVVIATININYM